MGKGEIACNEQFLLFPQCFLPIWGSLCHLRKIWNCRLHTLSIWKSKNFVVLERVNCFFTVDDTRSFSGQFRSRSDFTECAVWSLIYTVHIFNLDFNWIFSSSCNGSVFIVNKKTQFIYSVVKELKLNLVADMYQVGSRWHRSKIKLHILCNLILIYVIRKRLPR